MPFASLISRLKSTSWGLFFLINSKSIFDGYRIFFAYWWFWILPLALSSVISASCIVELWGTCAVLKNLVIVLSLVLVYALIRPSTRQKTFAYFLSELPRFVVMCAQCAGIFLAGFFIIGFLPALFCYVGLKGCAYDRLSSVLAFLSFTSLRSVRLLLSPLFAFIILFLSDQVPAKRLLPNVARILWRIYPVCLALYACWIIVVDGLACLMGSLGIRYFWGFDWYLILLFFMCPAFLITLANLYVKEVYGDPARYIS